MTIRRGFLKKSITGWTTSGRYHISHQSKYEKGAYVRTLSFRDGGRQSVITRGNMGWSMLLVVDTKELVKSLTKDR